MATIEESGQFLGSVNTNAVLVFLCTLLAGYFLTRKRKGLPPGPFVLPVIGNLLSLTSKDIRGRLRTLRVKYGDIYSLSVGNHLVIVCNGYGIIHEALIMKGKYFSNRPETKFMRSFCGSGIVFGSRDMWKHNRQFAQKFLQESAFGKTAVSLEEKIQKEVDILMELIERERGTEASEWTNKLCNSVACIIASIMFERRFDIEDTQLNNLLNAIDECTKIVARTDFLLEAFPATRYLPGDFLQLAELRRHIERGYEFSDKVALDENTKGLVEVYNKEMERDKSGKYNKRELSWIENNLLGAGSETTATTIRWFLLYLLHHPDVQDELHSEIDRVIGSDRRPSLDDRPKLPIVEAAILETLRIASPAPFAIPHTVDEDTEFRGYLIPANTTVIFNLDSALTDPNVWEEAYEFRPKRFLDSEGKLLVPKEFIPFSLGRRSCIGESLARMELFVYVTSLLQKFRFSVSEGCEAPPLTGTISLTYAPNPYQIAVEIRHV